MVTATKTPQIPPVPKDIPPSLKRWAESVKEVLEVREGSRGHALDKGVTFRDLVDAGVDLSALNIEGAPNKNEQPGGGGGDDVTTPDAGPPWTPPPGMIDPLPYMPVPGQPTHLAAVGGVGIIWVSWDNPQAIYRNHRFTEIWRSKDSASFANAVIVGTSPDGRYVDYVEESGSAVYYYWVRFVNTDDIPGPYSERVYGSNVYEVLVEQINDSKLAQDLREKIDTTETSAIESKNTLDEKFAEHTVKVQLASNGKYYTAGYGLMISENPDGTVQSEFIVDVQTFAVIDSSVPNRIVYPFIIKNGLVVIKEAAIGDATITSAKIAELDVAKLKSGQITVDTRFAFANDRFEIKTFIDSNGDQNAHLVVYDNQGLPRVQLGRSTDAIYGYQGFGLQIWDENGNPSFDANGTRVLIDQLFVNDLWAGGFKVTVPKSSFTSPAMNITGWTPTGQPPLEDRIIQTLDYDPQAGNATSFNLKVEFDVGYLFEGNFYGVGGDPDQGVLGAIGTEYWGLSLYGPAHDGDYSASSSLGWWNMCGVSSGMGSVTEDGGASWIKLDLSENGTCSGSVLITGAAARRKGRYKLAYWWASRSTDWADDSNIVAASGYSKSQVYNRNLTATGMR